MVSSWSSNSLSSASTLIATIGGQPQVLTFALDQLLRQGESVEEVVAIHLSLEDDRLHRGVQRLVAEFAGQRYHGRPCHFRHLAVGNDRHSPDVVDSEDAAEAVWRTVGAVIAHAKQQGQRLHLCVTGGPRMIGLMAMSVAMLHCDHRDTLWHLYTPRSYRQMADGGAILHADADAGVRLIRVPMAPWGAYFPALRSLAQAPSEQAIAAQTRWQDGVDRACCQAVMKELSARQLDVLRTFAEGKTPQDVAEALVISLKTVDSHKTVILAECRVAWGLDEGERLTYHFLREKFGPLYGKG